MWIGVPAVLIGAVLFVLGRGAGTPADGARILYPALLLYNYAAIQFAIVILLAASLLLVLWIPQAVRRLPRFAWNGVAMGLALAGALLACWGSLPRALSVDSYFHFDRAELAGRVYQLGARLALDGNNYYVLCDCARPGLICRCQHLPDARLDVLTERPELVADPAAQTLSIRIGSQTVLTVTP